MSNQRREAWEIAMFQGIDEQIAVLEKQKSELQGKRRAYDNRVESIVKLQRTMNAAFDAEKAAIAAELGLVMETDDDIPMVVNESASDSEPVNDIRRPNDPAFNP